MKPTLKTIVAVLFAVSLPISWADEKKKEDDHHHHEKQAGPNGGRVITTVEPHLEFLVTAERKVKITALDEDLKPVAMGDQSVRLTGGSRTSPTRLNFVKEGAVLLSDAVLPEGNDLPIVLQITSGDGAQPVLEKFNLNLNACPTCEHKEYACICDHGDEDHDHPEDKK